MAGLSPHILIWTIAALAVSGVILRPFNLPEAIWAVAGAALLVLFGLIAPAVAMTGVAKGTDVYLFLTGMMLLAEIARHEGLVRLARRAGDEPRQGLAAAAVSSDLCRRHTGHDVSFE